MALEAITDHVNQALARLELQFRDSADVLGLVSAIALEVQALEDAFVQLNALFRSVDNATGTTLDNLGLIVSAPARGVRSDLEVRSMIEASIVRNGSFGRVEDVIGLLNDILGIPGHWSATYAIDANDTSLTSPTGAKGGVEVLFVENTTGYLPPVAQPTLAKVQEALGFLRAIAPAGARVILAAMVDPTANVFTFDGFSGRNLDDGIFYSAFDRV